MTYIPIDDSMSRLGEGGAMRLGPHLHRAEGRDFHLNDATAFHCGLVVVGDSKAIILTLLRNGGAASIGLNICLGAGDAASLRDVLADLVADLERDASRAADAAIQRAGGKPFTPNSQTVAAPPPAAVDRAGRGASPPFGAAPGHHHTPIARLNRAIGSACLVTGVIGALWILGRAAWAVLP